MFLQSFRRKTFQKDIPVQITIFFVRMCNRMMGNYKLFSQKIQIVAIGGTVCSLAHFIIASKV